MPHRLCFNNSMEPPQEDCARCAFFFSHKDAEREAASLCKVHDVDQGWANFKTRGPQWVLEFVSHRGKKCITGSVENVL